MSAILRASRILTAAGLFVIATAAPALADPAEPTNFRSVVNSVEPAPTGVSVTVVGGDAFLYASAAPGHTVDVPGYFGEPYLRIDAEGRVWRNERSPARFINRDRYGLSGVPDAADAAAAPEWNQIAANGSVAWHDHRIHWMSTDLPPSVAGGHAEIVFPWRLTMLVDGRDTEIRGELLWFPSVNPAGPLLTGAVGILVLLAWRPGRLEPLALLSGVVGALALFVAVAQFAATPAFDRGAPAGAVLPGLAVIAAVAAAWLRSHPFRRWSLAGLSGAALAWWAWGAAATLTAPVLPSAAPVFLERGIVALGGWVGFAMMAIAAYEFTRLARAPQPVAPANPERSLQR